MAKRTTEAYISQMEKTSAYWKKKADREYAYAKKAYTKAKEFSERAENARLYGY